MFTTLNKSEKPFFKRILVAIDDSVHANAAVEYGGRLAKELSGRVMLFHVVHPDTALVDSPHTQQMLDEAARHEGDLVVQRAQLLLPPRVQFDCTQIDGLPAEEIVAAAKRWEADLIVMGTRGRGHVAQFLLGSTTEAVIRRATCPVLTIGNAACAPQPDSVENAYELT